MFCPIKYMGKKGLAVVVMFFPINWPRDQNLSLTCCITQGEGGNNISSPEVIWKTLFLVKKNTISYWTWWASTVYYTFFFISQLWIFFRSVSTKYFIHDTSTVVNSWYTLEIIHRSLTYMKSERTKSWNITVICMIYEKHFNVRPKIFLLRNKTFFY